MPSSLSAREAQNSDSRAAALAALQRYEVKATAQVGYRSGGLVLIIGTAERVDAAIEHIPESLTCHAVIRECDPVKAKSELNRSVMPVLSNAEITRITGFLGQFRVTALRNDIQTDVAEQLGANDGIYDLVLDLNNPPFLEQTPPPIGYFAPREDAKSLKRMAAGLADWVGEFDKPKYFDFREEVCAHSASGLSGCRLCIDACAAEAITSIDGKIRVDPYSCQGCGDCSMVCPSGAINYQYPARADTLNQLRHMLRAYLSAGGEPPALLFCEQGSGILLDDENRGDLPDWILPYEIESIGSVGMDIWLAAFAYGAARVFILDDGTLLPQTRQALGSQLRYAREILSGMGFERDLISLVRADEIRQVGQSLGIRQPGSDITPAGFAGVDDKRTAIRLAVDHLSQQSSRISESAPLSDGAPFGELVIDPDRCTLCMACVSVCPESALADGGDQPQLDFLEANCVQCGLCRTACPEDAISLAPRYVYDAQQARQIRRLHEEAVFRCVECGKPFATESMIETITERLKNHPMFQGENIRRLKMCEECRVKSMFASTLPPDSGNARRTV